MKGCQPDSGGAFCHPLTLVSTPPPGWTSVAPPQLPQVWSCGTQTWQVLATAGLSSALGLIWFCCEGQRVVFLGLGEGMVPGRAGNSVLQGPEASHPTKPLCFLGLIRNRGICWEGSMSPWKCSPASCLLSTREAQPSSVRSNVDLGFSHCLLFFCPNPCLGPLGFPALRVPTTPAETPPVYGLTSILACACPGPISW